jgi:hypothetical protein
MALINRQVPHQAKETLQLVIKKVLKNDAIYVFFKVIFEMKYDIINWCAKVKKIMKKITSMKRRGKSKGPYNPHIRPHTCKNHTLKKDMMIKSFF